MERAVVTVRIVGVPEPGVAVWKSVDDAEIAGDLDDPPPGTRAGDLMVLRVERDRVRWIVVDVVEHLPAGRSPSKVQRPHSHPARPPGTVVIA